MSDNEFIVSKIERAIKEVEKSRVDKVMFRYHIYDALSRLKKTK